MNVWELLLWLALAWVTYANVGYLALLFIVSLFIRRSIVKVDITPVVSLLIAAKNEELVIAQKLENSLALDYPRDKLEIVVMSDASTDRTDEIVRAFADRGVILHAVPDGLGKPNAMNVTVPMTSGEIIVISDADSTYAPDALRKLVRNFADPQVGAVTGEERRVPAADGTGMGEGFYCRLDNLIKRLEGRTGSMVMVNGGFFAVRRELYPALQPHLPHDSVVPCSLRLQGYRTIYEPEAISVEIYPLDVGSDFHRRIRTVLQAFLGYLSVPAALNPFRTGWYAVELLSHRFSRWFVLPWLLVALAANGVLASQGLFYRGLLIAQLACYACASIGWFLDRAGERPLLFYVPYYFVYIHLAAFVAVLQAVFGRRVASWVPTERSQETQGIEV